MAFTKITAAGIGSTETVTLDGLSVINNGSFGGNLTVGGVLTYEDVTNVDSVGLITARNGIVVGSGITLSKDGDIFATGITTISENLKVGTGVTISPDGDGFFTGVVTATSYSGDGSNLTGIDATQIITGNTSVQTVDTGSDGHVKVNTEGSERFRIDSSGNVNLGASAANTAIQASGPFSGATPKLEVKLGGASNSYTRLINIANPSGATGSETLGRVGIKLALGNESNSTETAKAGIIYAESTSAFNNGTSLCFATNNSERLRITSDGKIGIGNDNPSYPLVLTYADNTTYSSSNFVANGLQIENTSTTDNTASGIFFTAKGSGANAGAAHINCIRTANGSGTLTFSTRHNVGSHTERFRIASDGKIYVGGNGASATAGELWFNDTSAYSSKIAQVAGSSALTFHTGSSQPERARIDSGGRLLVNNTSSTSPDGFDSLIQVNASNHEGSITIGRHTANANGPALLFQKSRSGTATPGTGVVSSGDNLGTIRFYASDGTDRNSFAANIGCEVDGACGSNDLPGRLIFSTTRDGHSTSTERLRIDQAGVITSTYPTLTTVQNTNLTDTSGDRFVITLPDNSRMVNIKGSFSFDNTGTYQVWADFGDWSDSHSASLEGATHTILDGGSTNTYDSMSGRYFSVATPVDCQCLEVTYDITITTMPFFHGGSDNQGGARAGIEGTIRFTSSGTGNGLSIFSLQDTNAKATDRLQSFAWDIDGVSGNLGTGKHHYVMTAYPLTGDAQNLGDAA